MSDVQLWPYRSVHVSCSGLRGRRVGIVCGLAYVWRLYAPVHGCSRWRLERTRIASVSDLRDVGDAIDVGFYRSRSEGASSIFDDAQDLAQRFAAHALRLGGA